jgi:cathepsin C
MSRTRNGCVASLFFFIIPHNGVLADLPVHCLMQDVIGDWTFHVGPPEPPMKGLKQSIPQCGHHIPNNVLSMNALDRQKTVGEKAETLKVSLSETISPTLNGKPFRHIVATDTTNKKEGYWTMMFDEGMDIRFPGDDYNRSFFAHFYFKPLDGATRKPTNGDRWDLIAEYVGRDAEGDKRIEPKGDLYTCHCDMTSTGWWHRRTADGVESGCFWAQRSLPEKSGNFFESGAMNSTFSAVIRHNKKPKAGLHAVKPTGDVRVTDDSDDAHQKDVFLTKERSERLKSLLSQKQKTSLTSLRGATADGPPLPKSFDWREEMKDMAPEGIDDLSEQFDQGNCGSCYAFSGTQVLQMRFRIQLWKKHGIMYPLELSWKSATQCSPYTEGCEGGFAYLSFKQAYDTGLPLATCDEGINPPDLDQSCQWQCYKDNKMIFYAKDYGQTGGFSHGATEEMIMRELLNGPVIVSFSTTAMPEFIYNNGMSFSKNSSVMRTFYNDKVPSEKMSDENKDIKRWRYTTHSILAVGWGEEKSTETGEDIPYWIVRNSWGKDWGELGYAKVRRGQNDAAIETAAPWVEPDMDRLPPGFLEMARKYYESRKNTTASNKTQPVAKRKKNRGGKPDYCKMRPDSPDCQ